MSVDLFGRFENSRLDWNKASVRFLTYRFWLGGILRLKSQKVAAKITIRKFFGITQHMCWIILLPEQTIGKTFPVTLSDNVATWNFRRWRFDNLKGSRRVSSFSIDENEMEELIICASKPHTLHIFHKSFFNSNVKSTMSVQKRQARQMVGNSTFVTFTREVSFPTPSASSLISLTTIICFLHFSTHRPSSHLPSQ